MSNQNLSNLSTNDDDVIELLDIVELTDVHADSQKSKKDDFLSAFDDDVYDLDESQKNSTDESEHSAEDDFYADAIAKKRAEFNEHLNSQEEKSVISSQEAQELEDLFADLDAFDSPKKENKNENNDLGSLDELDDLDAIMGIEDKKTKSIGNTASQDDDFDLDALLNNESESDKPEAKVEQQNIDDEDILSLLLNDEEPIPAKSDDEINLDELEQLLHSQEPDDEIPQKNEDDELNIGDLDELLSTIADESKEDQYEQEDNVIATDFDSAKAPEPTDYHEEALQEPLVESTENTSVNSLDELLSNDFLTDDLDSIGNEYVIADDEYIFTQDMNDKDEDSMDDSFVVAANDILESAQLEQEADVLDSENASENLEVSEELSSEIEEVVEASEIEEVVEVSEIEEIVEVNAVEETIEETISTIDEEVTEETIATTDEPLENTVNEQQDVASIEENAIKEEIVEKPESAEIIQQPLVSLSVESKSAKVENSPQEPKLAIRSTKKIFGAKEFKQPEAPVNPLQTQIAVTQIDKLYSEFIALSKEVGSLKTALSTTIEEGITLQSEVDTLKVEVAVLKNSVESVQQEKFTEAEEAIHLKIDTFIMDMSDRFDAQTRGLEAFEDRISDLEKVSTDMETNIDELKSQIEENIILKQRIEALESTVGNMESLVSTIAAKVIREEIMALVAEDTGTNAG